MRSGEGSALRRFAVADDLTLVADVEGDHDATPVLLLHGGGQSRRSWGAARSALASAGLLAVALDQRGHGDSGWPPDGDYRLDAFAGDIREVATALGRPAMLVGASLGGLAAAVAVGERPGLDVAGLVLVDVAHRAVAGGAARILGFMTERPDGFASLDEAADAIAAYLPHRPRPTATHVARSLIQGGDGRWRWRWDPRFTELDRPNALRLPPERIAEALRAVACPTLLVRGGSSEIVSAEIAAEFRAIMPAARYLDIPKATHMIAGDDNDAFNAALVDFLRAIQPAP